MNTKILEEIGFTPKEVDVYLVMLGLKTATIFEIMSKAKVSRQSIYEILQKLLDKGLISYIVKNRKKQYHTVNPERMLDIIKEQETILKEKEVNLQALLPDLLKRYNKNKEDTNFEIFLGKEGMKTITNDILKVGKNICVLAGDGRLIDYLKYYLPQFIKKRVKLGLFSKVIYNESVREKGLEVPLSEIRYASEKYSSPIMIAIYGNNVNLIIFSESPVAIHIESKEIAKSFMNYFNLMWKIAKP